MDLLSYSTEDLLNLYRSSFYDAYGKPLLVGSDDFTSAAVETYVLGVLVNAINGASNQRFIDTATGVYLDAIAGVNGLTRPSASPASAAFYLTRPSAASALTIPSEAIVISDGTLDFTNLDPVYFPAGRSLTSALLFCTENGTKANGIPENSINNIVTGGYYISAGYNGTTTSGGFDGYPYTQAGDDAFREYIKNQRSAYVVGGSAPAYRAEALKVDTRITDVYVAVDGDSVFEKGKVKIFTLFDFDETLMVLRYLINQRVYNACAASDFRPIGDLVVVSTGNQKVLDIGSSWQVKYPLKFKDVCLAHLNSVLSEYRQWLYGGFGRPFSESEIARRLITPAENGVYALAFDYSSRLADWQKPTAGSVFLLDWEGRTTWQSHDIQEYIDLGIIVLIDTGE